VLDAGSVTCVVCHLNQVTSLLQMPLRCLYCHCVSCATPLCSQTALQTADKQTIVGSLKDMLYKKRMERELLRAKGE